MLGIASWDDQASLFLSCVWNLAHSPQFLSDKICCILRGISLSIRLWFQDKSRFHSVVVPTTPHSMIFYLSCRIFDARVIGCRLGWFRERPYKVQCSDSLPILPRCHYCCRISKFCSFGELFMHRLDGGSDIGKSFPIFIYYCVGWPDHKFGGGFC